MDDITLLQTLAGLAAGVGLAAACGLRVFLPLLIGGVALRLGALPAQDGLTWLGSTPALIGFGTATVLEGVAYYVPWLDNLLDSIATPASVIAGTLAAAALFVGVDPFVQWTLAMIVGGGAAGTVQLGTVATRAASTGTTGGAANFLVSTVEGAGAIALSVLAVVAPVVAFALVAVVLVFAFRALRRWRRRRADGALTRATG